MAKQKQTVIEFIANGRTSTDSVSLEFEGFETRGDEGNGLRFFKSALTGAPSQTPVQRGDNSFTDSDGSVYDVSLGSVLSFDNNQWFPPPFGSDGAGVYVLTPAGWERAATQAITQIGDINWDLSIPFNEGVEIERGYGNRDSFGNRSADFSRASGAENINKSGFIESITTDNPAINSRGLSIFGGYTNKYLQSEELNEAVWDSSVTRVLNATESSKLGVNVWEHAPLAVNQTHKLVSHAYIPQVGISCVSMLVKANELGIVQFGSNLAWSPSSGFQLCRVDFRTGQILSGGEYIVRLEYLGDGFYYLCHWFNVDVSRNAAPTCQLYSNNDEQVWTPNGTDSIYVAAPMAVIGDAVARPYIKTIAIEVSRAPDVVSVNSTSNIPAPGNDFSIVCDCALPVTSNANCAFRLGGLPVSGFSLRRIRDGAINFFMSDGVDASNSVTVSGIDSSVHRFICVFDSGQVKMGIDGSITYGSDDFTPVYSISDNLAIGRNLTTGLESLNSEIRSFRIIHRALSDAEILALGGPDV